MDYIIKKNRATEDVKKLILMELSYHGVSSVGDMLKIEDPKELANLLSRKRWGC